MNARSARTLTLATATAALTVAGALVSAPAATADKVSCRGTLARVTVDNVRVSDGATCRLAGTRVEGNVSVGTDATLIASGAARRSRRPAVQAEREAADRRLEQRGRQPGGPVRAALAQHPRTGTGG